jgi:UDP-2,4-diacetamido-2,4,6-trideoxy-beta-L-altropyranose hydrolase
MNVVFRVDASTDIGSGHLARCLSLATALRQRGVEVRFVCRDQPGNMADLLTGSGMLTTLLPKSVTSQQADAELTIEAMREGKADWMVVDHYGLDETWESAVRSHTRQILVIDDLSDRPHDCDVLLDQNYSEGGPDRYAALAPEDCQLLLGPRYALLGAQYATHRAAIAAHPTPRERILVFFGGTDLHDLTGRALEAISMDGLKALPADIVLGANNPHAAKIEAAAQLRPNTVVHRVRPHLADLLATARLALGAGGATTWERLCLGVPSVVVSLAANQVPTCEALSRAGYIEYLGPWQTVDTRALADASLSVLNDVDGPWHGSALPDLVDGLGSTRVCDTMLAGTLQELTAHGD